MLNTERVCVPVQCVSRLSDIIFALWMADALVIEPFSNADDDAIGRESMSPVHGDR